MESNLAITSLAKAIQSIRIRGFRMNQRFSAQPDSRPEDKPKQLSPPPGNDRTATYEDTKQELTEAIEGSNDVLASAGTVLTLFNDMVVLDRAKLTVTYRKAFRTAQIMSIRIEDILNVTASIGPFFGHLTITSRVLNSAPLIVGRFTRADALRMKRITQGYIIVLQREIDCNKIPTEELIEMLDKLGEDDHSNAPVTPNLYINVDQEINKLH